MPNTFGYINMMGGTVAAFRFAFVDKLTFEPLLLRQFSFAFLDVDAGSGGCDAFPPRARAHLL